MASRNAMLSSLRRERRDLRSRIKDLDRRIAKLSGFRHVDSLADPPPSLADIAERVMRHHDGEVELAALVDGMRLAGIDWSEDRSLTALQKALQRDSRFRYARKSHSYCLVEPGDN